MSPDPMTRFAERDPARRLPARDSDDVWRELLEMIEAPAPRRSRRRVRSLFVVSSFGLVGGAVALVVATMSIAPLSAAAATLQRAARLDASAAALPVLGPGQTLTQGEEVSMTCQVSSPSMVQGATPITYLAAGTVTSSTDAAGQSTVTITPSALGADGGHFAYATDEARWVAAGRPFIPCALGGAANQFDGNPANSNQGSAYGGYSATVSGFGGFGFIVSSSPSSIDGYVAQVNELPSDPAQLVLMLAAGEVAPDGTTSPNPQACPLTPSATTTGCDATQQVEIVAQLLQLPEASAKFGSVLYQVAATLPGSRLVGTVTTPLGTSGTGVVVPLGTQETLELVINPSTGALLECVASTNGVPVATVSYGPLTVTGRSGS